MNKRHMVAWQVTVEFYPNSYRGSEWYWELRSEDDVDTIKVAGRSFDLTDVMDDLQIALEAHTEEALDD